MSEQTWDFAQIASGADGANSTVVTTQGLLEEGEEALKMLAGVWGGAGSDAYQQVQLKWNGASDELNAALLNLADKIREAGGTMAQTENHVMNTFMA